jgi:hypothetical protein
MDASEQAWETARTDAALAAQAMSAAVFLAGLIANAQLETVGRPDKLPQDLWPHVPPEVAQQIFERGVAVGLHAGRTSRDPRLYRDQFARVQGVFEEIGFEAMGRAVGRSRRLVAPHPADGESARARGSGVTSSTSNTSWEQGDK